MVNLAGLIIRRSGDTLLEFKRSFLKKLQWSDAYASQHIPSGDDGLDLELAAFRFLATNIT